MDKQLYEAPQVQVIEMEVQASVMQASTGDVDVPGIPGQNY